MCVLVHNNKHSKQKNVKKHKGLLLIKDKLFKLEHLYSFVQECLKCY